MVNAAMTTQLALDNFNIERIIFSGIAGGVNPDLPIGTVVIPDQWAQYLEAFFSRENPDKSWMLSPFYQKALPEGGNYGMIFPQPLWIPHDSLGKPDAVDQLTWIKADTSMIEVARKVANSVELAKCNADDKCLDKQPFVKVGGNGVAGQAFVDNKDFRENYAWGVWKADSLDMESAAVAHVAYSNETPFIIFRSLSDLAGGGEGENEIALFFQVAADNSAKVFLAFVKAYVEQ
jgi:adenosylhomocysteine nucleosidase